MRGGFRLGRLFGIDVTADWSWGLVFALTTWNLTAVFRGWHPTWAVPAVVGLALLAALLFFASVLAHELGHAIVARSFGLGVREIRLFLFGGVSDLEREPPSPRSELWMALVGPLLSFALGTAMVLAAALVAPGLPPERAWESVDHLGPIPTLLLWLGPVNFAVGLFNLIPGFPLDGGRVLRAILWKLSGNLHQATYIATGIGRGFGWGFVFLGIALVFGVRIPLVGQGAGSGIWLAFIGWFLSSAAERSSGALIVEEVLEGITVGHLMRRTGPTIGPEAHLRDVVETWFTRSSERALPVIDQGRFVGLLSFADVRKAPANRWDSTRVEQVMTPRSRLVTVAPTDSAELALRRFGSYDVDPLPVVEGESLIGLLSRADITRWLELHLEPGFESRRSPRLV